MSIATVVVRRIDDAAEEVPVRECPLCGALVAEKMVRDHERFHAMLRRPAGVPQANVPTS